MARPAMRSPPHGLGRLASILTCPRRASQPLAANYVRFAFCKGDDTIAEACKRLALLTKDAHSAS